MRTRSYVAGLAIALGILNVTPCVAQQLSDTNGHSPLQGLAWLMLLPPVLIVVNMMTTWVASDANARGMGNSIPWMLFVFLTGPLGLVVYLIARPHRDMLPNFATGISTAIAPGAGEDPY